MTKGLDSEGVDKLLKFIYKTEFDYALCKLGKGELAAGTEQSIHITWK